MTKKDFEALAQALRHTRPKPIPYPTHEEGIAFGAKQNQWERDVMAVADVCSAANGRFNRERFYAACDEE